MYQDFTDLKLYDKGDEKLHGNKTSVNIKN